MKKFPLLILSICAIFLTLIITTPTHADELDDINKQINELTKSLNESKKATAPLESELKSMQVQIEGIRTRVNQIENDVEVKKKNIEKSYKDLEKQQESLNTAIRNYYMKSYSNNPLVAFLAAPSASELTQILAYQKAATDRDKNIITNIALTILDLEEKKKNLEEEQKKLVVVKANLDTQSEKLGQTVKGAKEYQSKLSSQIAQLSQKQQALIAQKLGSLNLPTSLGAGGLSCVDDRKLDPGFGTGFAFFTFGIPHRVGMNQYGANGRANSGQSHEDILRAYFENINFETRNSRIKVQGFGEMDLEEYMLGIYEMPNSFHIEALKAQAIAARSYALNYTNNGEKEICTTQSCQVYKGGNKGGAWEQAVKETAGKVMTQNGQAITAWYASTAGGYTFKSSDVGWSDRGWTKRLRDTRGDVGSFQDLINSAYDKESPCFYSAQGSRSEYAKSAWLRPSEVADIINVLMLAKSDSSTQTHLSQTDKPNPDGVDTWDAERVKQELRGKGQSPYNNVSDVSVDWDKGLGKTTTLTVSGDGGTNSFAADEFRSFFNLRAPSNIQIVGGLFNVEKR